MGGGCGFYRRESSMCVPYRGDTAVNGSHESSIRGADCVLERERDLGFLHGQIPWFPKMLGTVPGPWNRCCLYLLPRPASQPGCDKATFTGNIKGGICIMMNEKINPSLGHHPCFAHK